MPYYVEGQNRQIIRNSFAEILEEHPGQRLLDTTAVLEIISRYHCFGDRTLVEGVKRTPWMGRPAGQQHAWEYADVPQHGQTIMPIADVSRRLFELLRMELVAACEGKSTVGILLSGGMDSRIASGVLASLIRDGILDCDVVAITWGVEDARDVHYARRIADSLGWSWCYLPLSPEDLLTNIQFTAARGCEFSPVHLHAMPRVRKLDGIDLIVAASFGDSVGRAEYSGVHVNDLVRIDTYLMNWFKFMNEQAYQDALPGVQDDVVPYRDRYPRALEYQGREIERQVHYWRRHLNPCMATINERIPLYQLFSAPATFGFMWDLALELRNDSVYLHMFDYFPANLIDIPWARTGRIYGTDVGQPDGLKARHHLYGQWIREDLYDEISTKATSNHIGELGIFNMTALKNGFAMNHRVGHSGAALKLDEIMIWLAALSNCVEIYGLQAKEYNKSSQDKLNGVLVSPLQAMGHTVVNTVRRL